MPVSKSYVVQYQNNERKSSIWLRKRETNTSSLKSQRKPQFCLCLPSKENRGQPFKCASATDGKKEKKNCISPRRYTA